VRLLRAGKLQFTKGSWLGFAIPPTPPLRGARQCQVPSGTLGGRWDLGSHTVRLQEGPGQARIGASAPLRLGSRKGSEGWVEPLKGSSKEGPPKFGGNLDTTLLGEVPKRQGKVPWEPPVPFRPFLGHCSSLELATPWFLAIRRLSAVNLEINGVRRHFGP
jgi:hypothetical protein